MGTTDSFKRLPVMLKKSQTMQKQLWMGIRYLWCAWFGSVIGGLLIILQSDKSWPTDLAIQVARSEATAYARVCRTGLFIVVIVTVCIALLNKVTRKGAGVPNVQADSSLSG